MADQDGDDLRDARLPGELFRPTAPARPSSAAAVDLAEALGGLDRATRNFTRRLGEGQREVERARLAGEEAIREAAEGAPRPEVAPMDHEAAEVADPAPDPIAITEEVEVVEFLVEAPASAEETAPSGLDDPDYELETPQEAFDRRMREAETEAKEYLEAAKRRADSLVKTMVGAVEHEASEARREAEEGIRARWHQVEVDATRHVENARRVAGQMLAERQERITKLSDGITDRADALTAGMDDAERVRAQFESFIRALSETADRIAKEPNGGTEAGRVRELRENAQPSAMAA
ncbi:MAG: hypothetical protein KDB58_03455 [Solirubrobacterales bacterium]|nr:hypothetical protein [Solirubrobacterales bacterium]